MGQTAINTYTKQKVPTKGQNKQSPNEKKYHSTKHDKARLEQGKTQGNNPCEFLNELYPMNQHGTENTKDLNGEN